MTTSRLRELANSRADIAGSIEWGVASAYLYTEVWKKLSQVETSQVDEMEQLFIAIGDTASLQICLKMIDDFWPHFISMHPRNEKYVATLHKLKSGEFTLQEAFDLKLKRFSEPAVDTFGSVLIYLVRATADSAHKSDIWNWHRMCAFSMGMLLGCCWSNLNGGSPTSRNGRSASRELIAQSIALHSEKSLLITNLIDEVLLVGA